MGRGDYNTKYRKKGMPPSRNTVWGVSSVSDSEMTDRWVQAFGTDTPRKEIKGECECTCDYKETVNNGIAVITTQDCKLHGPRKKFQVKLTDIQKKFSKRHMKKVKECVMYGNMDIREVTDRNG